MPLFLALVTAFLTLSATFADVEPALEMGEPLTHDQTYSLKILQPQTPTPNVLSLEGTLEYIGSLGCTPSAIKNLNILPAEAELYLKGVKQRKVRFYLIEGKEQGKIMLGDLSEVDEVVVKTFESQFCKSDTFQMKLQTKEIFATDLKDGKEIVKLYSPFIVMRSDQAIHPLTDMPLQMGYQWLTPPQGSKAQKTLRYILYLSDEDSLNTSAQTNGQLARYGRRADIEWCLEIDFDQSFRVIQRRFQGSIMNGFGHQPRLFKGKFLKGGRHPILYLSSSNNIFDDAPKTKLSLKSLDGFHLVPDYEITYPKAREWFLFENPWLFSIFDREQSSEKKIDLFSHEQLYVLVEGELKKGSFHFKLQLNDGQIFYSGAGESSLDRLGQDGWGRQSFSALPINSKNVELLKLGQLNGIFSIIRSGTKDVTDLELSTVIPNEKPLRFFVITSSANDYRLEEVTSFFQCQYLGFSTVCSL